MGKVLRRTDVNPLPRFANPQSGFILVDDSSLDQCRFDLHFHLSQLPMRGSDKRRNAARREVDAQQVLQELARVSIGDRLPFHQIDSQGLNPWTILGWGADSCGKCGSCAMGANRTAFFFDPMLAHPEAKRWKIHHLTTFWLLCWLFTHIVLTRLTAFDTMHEHLIGKLDLLEVMPTMPHLATRFLAAGLSQTLRRANKAIGGRRQAAVVAVFGLLPLQFFLYQNSFAESTRTRGPSEKRSLFWQCAP
jgi:hypothetical protein